MSFRPFSTEELYAFVCTLNGVEDFPKDEGRSSDPYWKEAELLARFVNRKCREKGLGVPVPHQGAEPCSPISSAASVASTTTESGDRAAATSPSTDAGNTSAFPPSPALQR